MRVNLLQLARKALLTLIVCALTLGAAGAVLGRLYGYQALSVQSGSMAPLLQRGDAVIVARHVGHLQRGDIVSFVSPQDSRIIVTHRIVGIHAARRLVQTKGDHNVAPDPWIAESAVMGTVVYRAPLLGRMLDMLRTPLGLIAIVYTPAALIVIAEVRRLQQHYREGSTGSYHYTLHGY